jgi:hypothetical protein
MGADASRFSAGAQNQFIGQQYGSEIDSSQFPYGAAQSTYNQNTGYPMIDSGQQGIGQGLGMYAGALGLNNLFSGQGLFGGGGGLSGLGGGGAGVGGGGAAGGVGGVGAAATPYIAGEALGSGLGGGAIGGAGVGGTAAGVTGGVNTMAGGSGLGTLGGGTSTGGGGFGGALTSMGPLANLGLAAGATWGVGQIASDLMFNKDPQGPAAIDYINAIEEGRTSVAGWEGHKMPTISGNEWEDYNQFAGMLDKAVFGIWDAPEGGEAQPHVSYADVQAWIKKEITLKELKAKYK